VTAANEPAAGEQHDHDESWKPVAAPGNDLPAALCGGVHPEQVLRAAEDLDQIMADLSSWVQSCSNAGDAASGSTSSGGIGTPLRLWNADRWYAGPHRAVHRDSPLVRQIDALVLQLHTKAEALLRRFAVEPPVFPAGYPDLLATVMDLNGALLRLLCETWNLLANIDPLTGIGNRSAMLRHLQVERDRHERNRQPCCIAIIDVDRFKSVNDTCGHLAGDTILRSIASLLAASVRPYDVVFRYGGDEFILCLPNTDLRLAWAVVERLRLKIADWKVPMKDGSRVASSVSIGVAALASVRSVEDSLDLADRALYSAKRMGRNQICLRPD
jgi:diguanylate cyclase (GGDEF) domain